MIRLVFSVSACLLLLAFPFWSGPSGEPAIRPAQVVQDPRLYPVAFHAAWRPVLPAFLTRWIAPQPASALPQTRPSQAVTVKTWRDDKGVVHFSDERASPIHAQSRVIQPQANTALQPPAPVMRHQVIFLAILLLLTVLITQVLTRLASPLWHALSRLRLRLPARQQDQDEILAADPAMPITYQPGLSDPYQVLGLSEKASNDDLRAVYQRLRERYSAEHSLQRSASEQAGAHLPLQAIEDAWQQIRRERGLI